MSTFLNENKCIDETGRARTTTMKKITWEVAERCEISVRPNYGLLATSGTKQYCYADWGDTHANEEGESWFTVSDNNSSAIFLISLNGPAKIDINQSIEVDITFGVLTQARGVLNGGGHDLWQLLYFE